MGGLEDRDMTLRIALVGFGWWGRHIAARLIAAPDHDLICVVEPATGAHDDVRAAGARPEADFGAALADGVDAVILTSPNDLHDAHVAACIAAGKHVFCEKPLSLTAAGARASVEGARAAGLVLGLGHERRFEPALVALRGMLDDGTLGTIMHADLAFSHDKLKGLPADSWRTSRAMAPAAGMTQMGIHLTDLLISYFGAVSEVHAYTSDRSLGWETGDVVSVHLRFAAGMTATVQAILHTPHFIRTHVFGSDMWVEVRNATHPDTPGGKVSMECRRSPEDGEVRAFDWTDTVMDNIDAWAGAIAGGAAYPFTPFEMVHNIEVLEAIVASADSGEVVRLS